MKDFKFVLITFLAAIACISCEKDNVEIFHPNKTFYDIDYPYAVDYVSSHKFRYNSNHLVEYIDVGNETYEFFKYDDNNRIIKSYEIDNEDTSIFYNEYKEYSIIIDNYSTSGEIKGTRRILYYNKKGECIRSELWYYEDGNSKPFFNGTYKEYTWVNNNLVTLKEYSKYEQSIIKKFIYNTDVNPIRTLNCLLVPEWAYDSYLSYNNIDTIYYTSSDFVAIKYDYSVENKISRYYYYEPNNDWIYDYSIGLKN